MVARGSLDPEDSNWRSNPDLYIALLFAPERSRSRTASGSAVLLDQRVFTLEIVEDVEEGLPQALQDAVIPVVCLGP